MSIQDLLVPNNFAIYSGATVVGHSASNLESDNGNNLIDVSAAANPVANQGLVATGPNAATWQNVALETNALTLTNKTLTSNTNTIAATELLSNAGAQLINISNAGAPNVGDILSYTATNQADWIANVAPQSGTFKSVGAQAPGTTLVTVDLSDATGAIQIVANVTGIINTETSSESYVVYGLFRRTGPTTLVKDGEEFIPNGAGGFGTMAEATPTWELDAGNVIKLAKGGATNSNWGGTWRWSDSGVAA